jgi:ribosomal protein S4E
MITKFRVSILMTLFAVVFLIAMPLAQATTDVRSQNPQLTVSASAASSGENPNRATIGDTVKVEGSVTNNTSKKRSALVTVTVRDPQGNSIYTNSKNVSLVDQGRR